MVCISFICLNPVQRRRRRHRLSKRAIAPFNDAHLLPMNACRVAKKRLRIFEYIYTRRALPIPRFHISGDGAVYFVNVAKSYDGIWLQPCILLLFCRVINIVLLTIQGSDSSHPYYRWWMGIKAHTLLVTGYPQRIRSSANTAQPGASAALL